MISPSRSDSSISSHSTIACTRGNTAWAMSNLLRLPRLLELLVLLLAFFGNLLLERVLGLLALVEEPRAENRDDREKQKQATADAPGDQVAVGQVDEPLREGVGRDAPGCDDYRA